MVENRPCNIPSSLDQRPISERFFDAKAAEALRKISKKYEHITAKVDNGKKEVKSTDIAADRSQVVTKLRGELFSRMSPDALQRFITNE